MAILMRRTLTLTSAPILRSLRRMVAQLALANRVARRPRAHLMLDEIGSTMIDETCRKTIHQPDRPIRRPQQQGPGVRADRAAVERSRYRTAIYRCKSKQIRITLCRHRGAPLLATISLLQKNFSPVRAPMHLPPVRNPG